MIDFSSFEKIMHAVLVLDRDFNIIYANAVAKREYGEIKLGESKCHMISHGFDVPCSEFIEHPCPKKFIEENNLSHYSVIHLHETKLGNRYFLVDVSYNIEEQLFIEIHIEISEILEDLAVQSHFDKKAIDESLHRPILHTAKQYLLDEMERALENDRLHYAASIDVVGIRYLNKFYGMLAGDLVLKVIEKVIELVLNQYDKDARFAKMTGDEFLLGFSVQEGETIRAIEKALLEQLANTPVKYLGEELSPEVTISILEVNKAKKYSVHEVLEFLNYGQMQAKQRKEKSIVISDDRQQQQILNLIRNEAAAVKVLEKAIKEKRVDIHFQAIHELRTDRENMLEALVRLFNNDNEIIPAYQFIDKVIEIGLVEKLDTLVLEKLTECAPQLRRKCTRLFINVSGQSLESPRYIKSLTQTIAVLKTFGIDTVIELTEQVMLQDTDIISNLHSEHGFLFAVDDFGTGYSSLKTVADLAISKRISYLKVDGSITKKIDTSPNMYKIMKTIAVMAKSLELKVITEFVENEQTHRLLEGLDIDYAQGNFYGKPVPLSAL